MGIPVPQSLFGLFLMGLKVYRKIYEDFGWTSLEDIKLIFLYALSFAKTRTYLTYFKTILTCPHVSVNAIHIYIK